MFSLLYLVRLARTLIWTITCALSATEQVPATAVLATSAALAAERPLFPDEVGERTAALVMAIEWHESRFDNAAVSVTQDYCLMQVHGRPDLAKDPVACVHEGVRQLRWSIRYCPAWPLAGYAEGMNGCESPRAQRLSQEMTTLAARFLVGFRAPTRER